MTQDDEQYGKMIAEVREWLVRIDTNQQHQTKLLETLNTQADNAFEKADSAEDMAQEALKKAEHTQREFEEYRKEQTSEKRWLAGTAITVILALIPIIISFYT